MRLNEIGNILREYSILPFYQKGDNYQLDDSSIEPIKERMNAYILELKAEYGYNPEKMEIVRTFEADYKEYEQQLADLRISENAFLKYVKQHEITSDIEEYLNIKESFKLKVIPIIHLDTADRNLYDLIDLTKSQSNATNKQVILNHNNPFADITIENQEFLYPDTDGKFQTLDFRVGYTMTKVETENDAALAIQPDFKISKSTDRNSKTTSITMDDTISTPMPESQGEKELMYI